MIGTKFIKGKFNDEEYANCAEWCNNNNAMIVDQGDYYECVEAPAPGNEKRINELKQQLANTDYVIIKIAEGVATAEDYSEVLKQRQEWRNQINELEGAING